MLPRTTAIIGLGLIGGSLARELAGRGARVVAYDLDSDVITAALAEGIVQLALDDERAAGGADLIVIATPVDAALDTLTRLAPHLSADTVVTDVGSAKRAIIAHATGLGIGSRFVGSHPLAGDHRSGWAYSRVGLYTGVPVFLCPTSHTADSVLSRVHALWSTLGGRPELIAADEHDRRMAWTSHLPQIASSALATALDAARYRPTALGPGGRDVTRLAASSPEMWSAICLANADHVKEALAELQRTLALFHEALDAADPDALQRLFQQGRDWLT